MAVLLAQFPSTSKENTTILYLGRKQTHRKTEHVFYFLNTNRIVLRKQNSYLNPLDLYCSYAFDMTFFISNEFLDTDKKCTSLWKESKTCTWRNESKGHNEIYADVIRHFITEHTPYSWCWKHGDQLHTSQQPVIKKGTTVNATEKEKRDFERCTQVLYPF